MKLDDIPWQRDPTRRRQRWDSKPGREGEWVMIVKYEDGTYTILGPDDDVDYWENVDALTAQAVLIELKARGAI